MAFRGPQHVADYNRRAAERYNLTLTAPAAARFGSVGDVRFNPEVEAAQTRMAPDAGIVDGAIGAQLTGAARTAHPDDPFWLHFTSPPANPGAAVSPPDARTRQAQAADRGQAAPPAPPPNPTPPPAPPPPPKRSNVKAILALSLLGASGLGTLAWAFWPPKRRKTNPSKGPLVAATVAVGGLAAGGAWYWSRRGSPVALGAPGDGAPLGQVPAAERAVAVDAPTLRARGGLTANLVRKGDGGEALGVDAAQVASWLLERWRETGAVTNAEAIALLAVGARESGLNPAVRSAEGLPDDAFGGSWGIFQIATHTAAALGSPHGGWLPPRGTHGAALRPYVRQQADLIVKLLSQGHPETMRVPYLTWSRMRTPSAEGRLMDLAVAISFGLGGPTPGAPGMPGLVGSPANANSPIAQGRLPEPGREQALIDSGSIGEGTAKAIRRLETFRHLAGALGVRV